MTTCGVMGIALFDTGFWALCATMHLIDAKAEIKRLSTEDSAT